MFGTVAHNVPTPDPLGPDAGGPGDAAEPPLDAALDLCARGLRRRGRLRRAVLLEGTRGTSRADGRGCYSADHFRDNSGIQKITGCLDRSPNEEKRLLGEGIETACKILNF